MEFLAGNRIRGLSSEKDTVLISVTDLKSYWKFNETSGDIINQATSVGSTVSLGTGADLQVTGATHGATGIFGSGTAMTFDGTNDYCKAGTSVSQFNFLHKVNSTWSICFWAKGRILPVNDSGIFVTGRVATDSQIGHKSTFQNGANIRNVTANGSTAIFDKTTTNSYMPDTNFHFYTCRFDYTTFEITRDGGTTNSQTGSRNNAGTASNAMQAAFIGAWGTGSGFFDGEICELSIWDRVLTDAEVTSLYNSGSGASISSPINAVDGSIFYETDTNKSYVLYNGSWNEL